MARWLESDGTIDALEMTAGSSLLNPMYLFKGDAPVQEFAAVMPEPVRTGIKLIGSRFIREYPYQDGYLLEDARQIRAAVGLPMVLLGGITNKAIMNTAVAEGFQFVAMGRALLREPDLINRIAEDSSTRSLCNHNNKCMVTIFQGTRCVLVPKEEAVAAEPISDVASVAVPADGTAPRGLITRRMSGDVPDRALRDVVPDRPLMDGGAD